MLIFPKSLAFVVQNSVPRSVVVGFLRKKKASNVERQKKVFLS